MKTIIIKKEVPKLVISHDQEPSSPREDTNLGYFITVDRSYHSPDSNTLIESIVKNAGEEARSQAEHMKMIIEMIETQTEEKVLNIYPIAKHEHSGVSYSLGSSEGFDYSNNGFYIVTKKTAEEMGVKQKDFEKVIKGELEIYNKYSNGEIYQFTLYNNEGEHEDTCGGFYDIEEMRDRLPEEWEAEDLREYLVD